MALRVLTIISGVLLLFYCNTAVISGGGGPGKELVFKPFHGIYPLYHPESGEEWAWNKLQNSSNPPWWIKGKYTRLYYTSYETTTAPWLIIYIIGYWTLIVLLIFVIIFLLKRKVKRIHR
jgi:hypothetical protein